MKNLLFVITLAFSILANSQTLNEAYQNIKKDSTGIEEKSNTNNTIVITVSGSGKTQDEATKNAFRYAIEQTVGTFITTKTEILNDNVISDEITSLASGNIQSYDVLNASQLPDGSWSVIIKSVISINKLSSFVAAKGIAIEIKGGSYVYKIKQQILNEQAELKAIIDMVKILDRPMRTVFDYTINSGNPKSLDPESKNWEIPITVTAITNKNIDICANYFIKMLKVLSLSPEDVITYQNLKKGVFQVTLNYNGIKTIVFLRKRISVEWLETIGNNWEFYTRLFTIQSGLDEVIGKGKGEVTNFLEKNYDNRNDTTTTFNFLSAGQEAAKFFWQDKKTLSQIEKITAYKIKPNMGESLTITDIEGNVYRIMTIGSDTWMLGNLKTTKYNDGTSIPVVADDSKWKSLETGAYCDYKNNSTNSELYGRLYNWYAVNSGKLAPKGWHIATDSEWGRLTNEFESDRLRHDSKYTFKKNSFASNLSVSRTHEIYEGFKFWKE